MAVSIECLDWHKKPKPMQKSLNGTRPKTVNGKDQKENAACRVDIARRDLGGQCAAACERE
jgi:hypothetical protein